MKKEYVKPMAEMIEFVPTDDIMDDGVDVGGDENNPEIGGSGVEPW